MCLTQIELTYCDICVTLVWFVRNAVLLPPYHTVQYYVFTFLLRLRPKDV